MLGDPTPSLAPIERRYANEEVLQELREDNERGLTDSIRRGEFGCRTVWTRT